MRKVIIIIVAVLVVAAGSAAAYVWLANPGKPTVKKTASSSSSGTAQTVAVIVESKSKSGIGSYLADGNGNALYTYEGDAPGVSNCTSACLYSWPIYEATADTSLPTNITIINRSDGSKQYAYKGMPLYGFSGDAGGDVRGDGVSGFHVAKP